MQAARRLIKDYPQSPASEKGAAYLLTRFPADVPADEMAAAALVAGKSAPLHLQPFWLVTAANRQFEMQKTTEAKATAQQGKDLALKLQREVVSHSSLGKDLEPHLAKISQALVAAEELLAKTP